MKKKQGSRLGRTFKRIINVRAWIDYDRTKKGFDYLKNVIKQLFVPQKQTKDEDFETVVKKMNLSEPQLFARQNALKRWSLLMLTFACGLFLYAGYQFFYGSLHATVVSLVVMLIALALSFRYHFWYFQMKHRTLGCTLSQWFRQGLMGEKE